AIQHLKLPEMRVPEKQLDEILVMRGQADSQKEPARERERKNQSQRSEGRAAEQAKVTGTDEEQRQSGQEHCYGVGEERDQEVANEDRSDEASDGADGGQSSHIPSHIGQGGGDHFHEERHSHRKQREGHEEQDQGCQQGPNRQVEAEAPVRDWFASQ